MQDWFDRLPEEDQDEVRDLMGWLQNQTSHTWHKPEFDPLEGEGGISEIRIDLRSAGRPSFYRIYGFFGPTKGTYTFLHATDKDVKNDHNGKRIAREHLGRIQRNDATTHEFDFEGRADSQIDAGTGRPN